MTRLGELLVAAGLLTVEQIDQALRAQVMWGGRLGTNLIELGCLDLDALSRTLGTQHHLPPALAKHFDKADVELQKLLSPDVAEKLLCVPLLRVGAERNIVLAATGPLDKRALGIVAAELEVEPRQLVLSVAAELRIRYHLERTYKIPRDTRFLRSRGKSIPPFPSFQASPPAPPESDPDLAIPGPTDSQVTIPLTLLESQPVILPPPEPVSSGTPVEDLDDLSSAAIADDELPIDTEDDSAEGRDRRRYVETLGDVPSSESERQRTVGRIAVRRVAITTSPESSALLPGTIGEATRAIRRSTDRDRVAELVVETLDKFAADAEAALILVVRNETAIGWRGFSRQGTTVPMVSVPLEQDGLIPKVIETRATSRCAADELSAIDNLLLRALNREEGDLVVVPVTIGGQVMCVIATVTQCGLDVSNIESVAAAAGAAFARLMRDASR